VSSEASGLETTFDDIADGYARWWGPVIAPEAVKVLDLVAPVLNGGAARVLDVGTGTGVLAISALQRWPRVRVTGVDPSGEMLEVAGDRASAFLPAAVTKRYARVVAGADAIPFEDAAFDVAVSSFALQLVPDRGAALREIRRVLASGATFAWVSWLETDRVYEPDRVANAVLDGAGFDPPEAGDRGGDFESVATVETLMQEAGFQEVAATEHELAHAWTPDQYVGFFTKYDEQSLFDELEPAERDELEAKILEGVRALPEELLTLRLPIVFVTGRAPGG
jgi:SAM-dependent methyltransferase